jgi:hypothetical protein
VPSGQEKSCKILLICVDFLTKTVDNIIGSKKMKYIVGVRKVYYSYQEIEADSPDDAREKVFLGNGDKIALEYSHTSDSYDWTVEEKE